MPELPEVETMKRGLAPIVGCRIVAVRRPRCRLKPIAIGPTWRTFQRRSVNRRIAELDRVGKRVVVRLDDGGLVVFEPRMTGLVLIGPPPNLEHLRLVIELAGRTTLRVAYWDRRGLGSVWHYAPIEFALRFDESAVGPDALALAPGGLRSRLESSRRAIKVALLDQRAVAGIGNLYASEMLHRAHLDPRTRCCNLRGFEWDRLEAVVGEVLTEAIRYEGSTLGDGTYRNALSENGSYQNHHRVYAREGEPCTTCTQGVVQRIVQAQRATFFCPRCQPRRRQGPL